MNFPAELVDAFGWLPSLVQESQTPITVGRNLLSEFYCGYTRDLADQAARGQLEVFDGFLLADHCIQLLGSSDVIRSESPGQRQVYLGQFMSSLSDGWARDEVRKKINAFVNELESATGSSLEPVSLSASISAFNENRALIRTLLREREEGTCELTAYEMQVVIKSSMVMDKREHSEILRKVIADRSVADVHDHAIRVHLSGHFCHAPKREILDLIEECGAVVVGDDLFHGERYVSTDVRLDEDPVEALVDWYMDRNTAVPCPTRVQHDVDWQTYLLDAVMREQADAVVVLMAKFCEPHMLYYPELTAAMDAAGVPHLLIETEHEGVPAETLRTRLEALLERIRRATSELV